jgi:hypothetical protein
MEKYDKYGILKLNKTTGSEWFNKWDNDKSRTIGTETEVDPYDSNFRVTIGKPDYPCYIKGDGALRLRSVEPLSSVRLWVEGPWLNTEMTCYAKKVDDIEAMPDFQMRSRANHLIGGMAYQSVFGNYEVAWGGKDRKVSIAVEVMHPIYKRYLIQKAIEDFPVNAYVGFKQVTRTIEGNKVKVEGWFSSKDKYDQTSWEKQLEFIFTGDNVLVEPTGQNEEYRQLCVDKGDKAANDLSKNTLWLNKSKRCWLRLNYATKFDLRYFSIREIAPLP